MNFEYRRNHIIKIKRLDRVKADLKVNQLSGGYKNIYVINFDLHNKAIKKGLGCLDTKVGLL